MIAAIDLEGALAPGIRPPLGDRFGTPELHQFKRDTVSLDILRRYTDNEI